MVIYDSLSRLLPFKKSYTFKFLAIAFVGVHVPLIGIAIYFATSPLHIDATTIIVFILLLTLTSTFFTLLVLNKLLAPLQLAKQSLDVYLQERRLPTIPMHYEDEAGVLLSNIRKTVEKVDLILLEKTGVIDLLSHDLRSPLARIIGLAQVQKIDQKAGLNNIYSEEIMEECNHALALLNEVLSILKTEEQTDRNITLTKNNLLTIVNKCIASLDMETTKKGITWAVDIDPVYELQLEPTLFTQAVKNVLSNAIKFSSQGGMVNIQSKVSGRLLYLTVKDEGIGFELKDKEVIFNRFTGAGRKGTRGESTTGLGLYLSKKITQRHGGDLIAESDGPNKGAVFTFMMPFED